MDTSMQKLVDTLHYEQCSCVIRNNGETRLFHRRGVADLLWLLEHEPDFLHGAWVADKVVGRGAAALLILGGVVYLHSDVLSQGAFELLEQAGLQTEYDTLVSSIINRAGTGPCPVESLCMPLSTPEEMLPCIRAFVAQQKQ